jgi:hypothetical protein
VHFLGPPVVVEWELGGKRFPLKVPSRMHRNSWVDKQRHCASEIVQKSHEKVFKQDLIFLSGPEGEKVNPGMYNNRRAAGSHSEKLTASKGEGRRSF